jgi:hypothetical protein
MSRKNHFFSAICSIRFHHDTISQLALYPADPVQEPGKRGGSGSEKNTKKPYDESLQRDQY